MINFISLHPYLFSTIAILFLIGVIIMVYEVRRAIKVPDDYEEVLYFSVNCLSFMAFAVYRKLGLRT